MDELVEIELFFGNTHVKGKCKIFSKPIIGISINNFVNDNYCEVEACFKKDKLQDLIESQLELDEHTHIQTHEWLFLLFHNTEAFTHILIELTFKDLIAFITSNVLLERLKDRVWGVIKYQGI